MQHNPTGLAQAAEYSLTTTYRKTIWHNFVRAMQAYQMTRSGDKIAVCVSGGKDSLLLAKCLQLLQKHSDVPFELIFLCMDPGFTKENRQLVAASAQALEVPLAFFDKPEIFAAVEKAASSPCHICAAMRRGALYEAARSRGCNKIALGHHFDDAVETVLLSMLYGGELKTMLPRLRSEHFAGMELIRPLYHVRERHIVLWARRFLPGAMACACRVTRREDGGKRREIKRLLATLEQANPHAANNIFHSVQQVNLDTLLSWRKGKEGQVHSFLEDFGKGKAFD